MDCQRDSRRTFNGRLRTAMQPTTPLSMDAPIVAIGREVQGPRPHVDALLADISHIDPDRRPLLHTHLWEQVHRAHSMPADQVR